MTQGRLSAKSLGLTKHRHLLGVEDLDASALVELHEQIDRFVEVLSRPNPKVPALTGKTVATMFYEDSTRTRVSFETAARRLSADVMGFAVSASSVKKGESLRDTAATLGAMRIDALVVRHGAAGAPVQLARWVEEGVFDAAIVNAGDGWHQHPTQALTDTYTLARSWLVGDGADPSSCFSGLRFVFAGDLRHSRVLRSSAVACAMLGAQCVLVGPVSLHPSGIDLWLPSGCSGDGSLRLSDDLDTELVNADVVYLLRVQSERQNEALFPSGAELHQRYGLTEARLSRLKPTTAIMHPGPMNRGVEISSKAADHPNSLIVKQVANGVASRMAVLYRLLGGEE